jgi:hypothetical protein
MWSIAKAVTHPKVREKERDGTDERPHPWKHKGDSANNEEKSDRNH